LGEKSQSSHAAFFGEKKRNISQQKKRKTLKKCVQCLTADTHTERLQVENKRERERERERWGPFKGARDE